MPASPQVRATKPRRRGAAIVLLALAVIAPVAVLALPVAALLGIGLIPTLVAWVIDEDDGKYAALTVGPMNLCGLVPTVLTILEHGYATAAAVDALGRPATWLFAFGAAGVGWMLYFGVPGLAAAIIAMRIEGVIGRLEREQAELVEEWGPEVKRDARGPAPEGSASA